jgi:hypothetical protein
MTFSPESVTAGLELEDFEVTVNALDANGDPLPEGLDLYLWIENDTGDCELLNDQISLDEDGIGEFTLNCVGDIKTWINITLDDNDWEDGNLTCGNFMIEWPIFNLEPDTIFIGIANLVTITATDYAGEPIEGLNLTLWTGGTSFGVPDPVETDVDGQVEFSIQPEASGKANVTIVRGIEYIDGALTWDFDESILTDTYLTITAVKTMKISVSMSPVFEGYEFTATVTSGGMTVDGADVEFAGTTMQTDANGEVTFTAPDPGVESAIYTITAEKTGYLPEDISITVIKVYDITIVEPDTAPGAGEKFTITILAKGQPLAGAEVTFNGKTSISGGDGKLSLTAPSEAGDYTITATFQIMVMQRLQSP